MQKIDSVNKTLQDNMIIQKDYQESIFVLQNKTLTIEGQTNRLIIVGKGGTVIVKGNANRINGFGGTVIVQKNGFVDSIYSGGGSKMQIYGKIHEAYILRGAELTMRKGSYAIQITNDDSTVNVMTGAYIKQLNQFGKKARENEYKKSKVEKHRHTTGISYFYNEEKE